MQAAAPSSAAEAHSSEGLDAALRALLAAVVLDREEWYDLSDVNLADAVKREVRAAPTAVPSAGVKGKLLLMP